MHGSPNVKLYVGEIVYGDGDVPFEVTGDNPGDCQFRAKSVLFHKENCLNEIVKRFPADWKYGAYIDGDFSFTRHDWALEAVHQLQLHPFVQLFSAYTDLTSATHGGHQPMSASKSFAATFIGNGHRLPSTAPAGGWSQNVNPKAATASTAQQMSFYAPAGESQCMTVGVSKSAAAAAPAWIPVGATGGAWAFTRNAFDAVGGMMDQCILGHADWFMAFGLVSQPTRGEIADSRYHPHYTAMVEAWQTKAAALKSDIGAVDGFAVHHWHGSKRNRGYDDRDFILVRNQFDPIADLRRNAYGIYELAGNKPQLRDDILRYFYQRNEDDLK